MATATKNATQKEKASDKVKSPEEYDRLRKEAQQRKKRAAKSGSSTGAPKMQQNGGRRWHSIEYGAVKPRAEREREQQARERAELRARNIETGRIKQATKAMTSTNISTLTKGSKARHVAERVLFYFPQPAPVQPDVAPGQKTPGPLAIAIAATKDELEKSSIVVSEKAFKMGVDRARFALNWAHEQLKNA